jgi:hypothetical protein
LEEHTDHSSESSMKPASPVEVIEIQQENLKLLKKKEDRTAGILGHLCGKEPSKNKKICL